MTLSSSVPVMPASTFWIYRSYCVFIFARSLTYLCTSPTEEEFIDLYDGIGIINENFLYSTC